MNTRKLLATSLAALALAGSMGAFAQNTDSATTTYRYGMNLDISKVISIEEPSSATCEVVESTMTYLNSAGEVNAVTYRTLADACKTQN
ncbi:DUF2790 domain-containing protein [Pseudomonas sp. GD03944]|uniref:DUF2790 domain-containing protein n=1 Tax=Pseudomonas sp. GD03944 TaxID=2975409 RepID=UPI002449CB24|nr:DUF2790 domain-containing protein [Pseudomonas sp. GD03944]MDH1262736.1 DUF2790 domain-containing protein [Pseudomonas sp. GD03944]